MKARNMMRSFSRFISGLLFGVGLILSGMTEPQNIIGFLDVAGSWNPRLALVMLGAVAVSYFGFRYAGRREKSLLGEPVHLPTSKALDTRLIVGALLFGIGWGLVGYCPGPALASLASLEQTPLLFVLAMLVGMGIYEAIGKPRPTN
jgi:uncharacterized membrane protein YedE/YeeE